ncbi:unnamed protein product [Moneuplotes crassus]|uniref:SET domain-containing protein n=1 Tax=Euplotes crassus TaxID=5936 RepID=A0AAD1X7T5_EUPCR|nr:unnamed protein product [Moneuplotes crassus]
MGKGKKKSKSKQINKNTTNPKDLKELGNKAFLNKLYEEAITYYTKAIDNAADDDEDKHVYFSNRAAAYFEMKEYEKSLEDAAKSVEIKDDFAKGYIRKAQAERELLLGEESLTSSEKAIEIDPDNEHARELYEECKQEWDDDHTVEESNPHKQRFNRLETWLKEGGSKYEKLKIRFYNPIYRGVHAAKKIRAGEEILLIPKEQIITLEMAEESPIGAKMMYHNVKPKLLSPKHGFLATYILQERLKGEESPFHPFIDILPKTFENFPIFFTEEERAYLEGSPFLAQVLEKIEDIKTDYDLICSVVPEYSQFTLNEFSEIRMMVSSRIFGMNIDGKKTDGFVPMADMLNHKRPKQTSWTYSDEKHGFVIEALKDIGRNEQVYDSYGKKCNSRFFLNYGFIVENNDGNEVPLKIYYPESDDKKDMKKEMIGDLSDFKKFRVTDNFNEGSMHEFMSWMRFVEYDENITLLIDYQARAASQTPVNDSDSEDGYNDPNKGFKAKDLPPLSIRNEKKVLLRMKLEAAKVEAGYPTTYEEDLALLEADEGLTFNTRNVLLMRSGEKKILRHLIETADIMLRYLDYGLTETRKQMKEDKLKKDQEVYIKKVIQPLIKMS